MKTFILLLCFSTSLLASPHAKELLGPTKAKSLKVATESSITKVFKERLPKKYVKRSKEFSRLVITESKKYNLDPYFVLAVISGESNFNPEVKGPVGEIGFMQLRPATGEWMSYKLKIKWQGEKTLKDPVLNIKLGVIYISWLRSRFNNNPQGYIAAYNMGEKNVLKSFNKKVIPKDYPRHVMKRYLAFVKK